MKLKTFAIIEKKWARGGKKGPSMLQNASGNRCCLGFLCRAAGFKRLADAAMPEGLVSECEMRDKPYPLPLVLSKLKGLVRVVRGKRHAIQTTTATRIAAINDDDWITDEERKRKLAILFSKIGWKPVYK